MSEEKTVKQTNLPFTVQSLAQKLRECGLEQGQTVLVHTSLSKLGWVMGGPQAVILALLAVLGKDGTLMMPSHTSGNSDPAEWSNPPVPEAWWQPFRENAPAFDAATSPTRSMGAVAELFRTWPGVRRSNHPSVSFAALGPNANFLTQNHVLEDEMGIRSPLGRLHELDGHVLLLGVHHWNNSSLHLAEAHANYAGKQNKQVGCAMQVDGKRQWVQYDALDLDSDDFYKVGTAFEEVYPETVMPFGETKVRFFRQRPLIKFAVQWMEENRRLPG